MKKKICFVFMGNLFACPYIYKYLNIIDCEYDIIYWNRDSITEKIDAKNTFIFEYPLSHKTGKVKKILGYLLFSKYAKQILKENEYDGVILLQTAAGLVLKRTLQKKYKNRYIMDIRDYTGEKNNILYLFERGVIKNSSLCVVSSEGYKAFLPPFEYVITHNDRYLNNERVMEIRKRNKRKEPIVIAFIGTVNYQNQHKELLTLFKNDGRFILHFIGKEAEKLLPFCKENNINNVKILGKFPPERILDYYQDVDIVNNLYGSNIPALDYALSNKLYFAAQLGMPILVCPGTFMEKVSKKYGFGYSFDFDDVNAVDKLYEFYMNINWDTFQEGCTKYMTKVVSDNILFEKSIINFVKE